jgi:hypothetical protein
MAAIRRYARSAQNVCILATLEGGNEGGVASSCRASMISSSVVVSTCSAMMLGHSGSIDARASTNSSWHLLKANSRSDYTRRGISRRRLAGV